MFIARNTLTRSSEKGLETIPAGSVIEDFARWPYVQQKPLLDYGDVEKVGAEAPSQVAKRSEEIPTPPFAAPTLSLSCPSCPDKAFASERGLRLHKMKVHGE